ncbi:MAG: hypothetical protein ACPHK1_08485 [Pseudohongiellaceae bacterium]
MRAVSVSLIASLSSSALLTELPDPQWIVLAAVFGLALAIQWQSGLNSNLLIASHHVSNGSSSYPFMNMVSAEFVVFSNGYKNGFNHPHPRVRTTSPFAWYGVAGNVRNRYAVQLVCLE